MSHFIGLEYTWFCNCSYYTLKRCFSTFVSRYFFFNFFPGQWSLNLYCNNINFTTGQDPEHRLFDGLSPWNTVLLSVFMSVSTTILNTTAFMNFSLSMHGGASHSHTKCVDSHGSCLQT